MHGVALQHNGDAVSNAWARSQSHISLTPREDDADPRIGRALQLEAEPWDPPADAACLRDTGGPCSADWCNASRGPTSCESSKCVCQPPFCAGPFGRCSPSPNTEVNPGSALGLAAAVRDFEGGWLEPSTGERVRLRVRAFANGTSEKAYLLATSDGRMLSCGTCEQCSLRVFDQHAVGAPTSTFRLTFGPAHKLADAALPLPLLLEPVGHPGCRVTVTQVAVAVAAAGSARGPAELRHAAAAGSKAPQPLARRAPSEARPAHDEESCMWITLAIAVVFLLLVVCVASSYIVSSMDISKGPRLLLWLQEEMDDDGGHVVGPGP